MGTAREAREARESGEARQNTASRAPRGRWLAAGLLAATCATAAVAAHVGRGWIEDSWWIWLPALKRCLDEMPKDTRPAKILERLLDRSVPLKPAFVLRYW